MVICQKKKKSEKLNPFNTSIWYKQPKPICYYSHADRIYMLEKYLHIKKLAYANFIQSN